MEAMKTSNAIPIVMQIWLVNEKANGNSPTTLPTIMKRNSVNMYGKISTPLFPEFDFTTLPIKKNNFSISSCNLFGIKPLSIVPSHNVPQISATTRNINNDELVIERSSPKILIGIMFFT